MDFSNFSLTQKKLMIMPAVVCVSFSAILVRFAGNAPSMILVFYRNLLAGLIMTIPCIRQLKREYRDLKMKEVLGSMVSGVFLAFHFTCYFESLKYTSISSAVVLVDMEVFFVAFIMLFLFKERISKRGWIGIIIAFIGSVIIAGGDAGVGSNIVLGDVLAIGGSVFLALYTIMGRVCRKTMSTTVYTTIVYWTAALCVMVFLLVQGTLVVGWPARTILLSFGMTILCTLLGHSIYSWGLKFVDPVYISTIKLLEPVMASILGIFFFMEIPGFTAIAGGLLIIGGIMYYMRGSK